MIMIITIGREHGSCGHDIARKLAEQTGMKCYDKEIVEVAAGKSSFNKEIFDSHDEKRVSSFIMSGPNYMGLGEGFRLNMQVASEQFDAIRTIAEQGDCIFVGRCADYILRNKSDLITVFIYSDDDFRISNLMKRYNLDHERAKKLMKEVDKDRSSYYRYYTDQVWGDYKNYMLCINSAKTGVDGAVAVIKAFVDNIEK